MIAVRQHGAGGAEQLFLGLAEEPSPGPEELLVRVMVTALNRADVLQREGKYPPPAGASSILGLELAGIIVKKGAQVTGWELGDRVFGLVPGGAYAEKAVIHQSMAIRMPDRMTFEECAAIPEVFLTAYQALRWLADLQKGEKVLLHAGASGVGTAAIQLAREMAAEVLVSASAGKHDKCLSLGAAAAFDYRDENFWDEVGKFSGGVDVIVDPIGGGYFAQNLKLLKPDGRLVMLAVMGGVNSEAVNVGQIVFKRLRILGTTLRSRTLTYQIGLTKSFWQFAGERFISGALVPVIDRVFDWEEVAAAHRYLESNRNTGKVLLKIG